MKNKLLIFNLAISIFALLFMAVLPVQAKTYVEYPLQNQALNIEQQEPTPLYSSNIPTSTPQSDGAIYHIVQAGENLWSIAVAYGMTGAEIMTLTGNSPETTDVYIGQVLTIRRAFPATPTLTLTPTPTRITPRPTEVLATKTPVPSKTPLPTATPTLEPPMLQQVLADNKLVGMTLAGVSLAGFIAVVIFGFLRKK